MNFLDWAVLSVSFFNTICLFWLGLMVLLNGSRRAAGTWITGAGLLLAGLFFTSHTAIMGRGLAEVGFGMDFWWWVSWTPAVVAPFFWYAALLWYAGLRFDRPHPHRFLLAGVVGLGTMVVLLIVFANPLPTYNYVASRQIVFGPSIAGIPLLILFYILYSLACYLLPVHLLLSMDLGRDPLTAAARRLARPWLTAASLSLLAAGVVLAWTALWALQATPPTLSDPGIVRTVKLFDVAVAGLVGLAITLLGRTIVAYEVFTGRPLPRLGFFHHWRSTVLLAGGFGMAAAWSIVIDLRPLYSLMLATLLMTGFYALYSWRSFGERESFMARLRPFVASQDLYGKLIGPHSRSEGEGSAPDMDQRAISQSLFETLCRDVLEVRSARLAPTGNLATFAGPPLVYGLARAGGNEADGLSIAALGAERFPSPRVRYVLLDRAAREANGDGLAWAVPLWNERGLGGVLFLGQKIDENPFTEEEMDLAQAGGERLLDMLAGVEIARLAMNLLRQRISQVRVAEGRGRRELHDEILPLLHTAILELSGEPDQKTADQAVQNLAAAHRRISNLVRELPPPVPERLAQLGLAGAFQALLANDFSADFDEVSWDFLPDQAGVDLAAGRLPAAAAEVFYFAARELVRNAARHARREPSRPLHLHICLDGRESCLRLVVEDNGVGLGAQPGEGQGSRKGGTGSGLKFHSAMLAAVGGSLEVGAMPDGGVRGVIWIEKDL